MGMPIARQSEQYNVHQAQRTEPARHDEILAHEVAESYRGGRSVQAGYNNPRAHRREAFDFPGLDTLKGLNPFGGGGDDKGGESKPKGTGLEGFPSLNGGGDSKGSEPDTDEDFGDTDDQDFGGLRNDEGLGALNKLYPGSDEYIGDTLPGSAPKSTGGPNIQYV
ncbi:hypothetical protein SEA_SKOG_178 [Gordonia phage Skog]|uniref:Uncharacterized protein n=1 Tax=Gordonia phage Skog TaxID=2704033 RepID=A0A6G6XKP1_9CAUD|nr:hypothetical protein KHQ85_gp178 [Gordonia phage Skog]QIG58330.1 hypothetical protein SEA_SKOG_178 [Gordonia phage Skog]